MHIAALADRVDPALESYLARADVLVTLGDVRPHEVPLASVPHLFVYGNHDSPNDPFDLDDGRRNLHLRVVDLGGVRFGGFQGAKRYKPRGHFLYEDDEVALLMSGFPSVDVFVAHAPCTLLGVPDGVHDGFRAFDSYLRWARPRLFLCGHTHRNRSCELGSTRCVSVYGAAMVEL